MNSSLAPRFVALALLTVACGDDGGPLTSETASISASAGDDTTGAPDTSTGEPSSSSSGETPTSSDGTTTADDSSSSASEPGTTGGTSSSGGESSSGAEVCGGADEDLILSAFVECETPGQVGQVDVAAGVTCAQVCCVLGFGGCMHRAAQLGFEGCNVEMPEMTGACEDVFEDSWSNHCICTR